MTDDPRDLLTEAAPQPAQPVDLGRVVTTARHRRFRTRALAAAASVVVVAGLVVGVTSLSSGGDRTVAVRAGTPTTTSDTPAGWTRVTVDGAGISIAIPPEWQRDARGSAENEVVVVGTSERPSPAPITACLASSPAAEQPGTWVSLYEYPAGTTSFTEPGGGTIAMPVIPDRSDFHGGQNYVGQGSCAVSGSAAEKTFGSFVFTDAGRVFYAHLVTVGTTDPAPQLLLAKDVLNTLDVEPAAVTPSTTFPVAPTTEPATTTVPTTIQGTNGGDSFNPTTTDQQQIRQAFLGWLNGKNLDQAAPWIEDYASIRDSEAQGFAQHTPEDIAQFSGRVESVVVADANHADVVYTLLHGGAPLYANRPGKAVKVNGKWLVTRDTACGLLSLGGITCPPRTTPAP